MKHGSVAEGICDRLQPDTRWFDSNLSLHTKHFRGASMTDFKKLLDEFVGVICREEQAAFQAPNRLSRRSIDSYRATYNAAEAAIISHVAAQADEMARLRKDLTTEIEFISNMRSELSAVREDAKVLAGDNLALRRQLSAVREQLRWRDASTEPPQISQVFYLCRMEKGGTREVYYGPMTGWSVDGVVRWLPFPPLCEHDWVGDADEESGAIYCTKCDEVRQ